MKSHITIRITVDDEAPYDSDSACLVEKEVCGPEGYNFIPVPEEDLAILDDALGVYAHNVSIKAEKIRFKEDWLPLVYSRVSALNNLYLSLPMPKPEGRSAYVYLLKCADKYKIGYSSDVDRRMKQLDTRPFPLELIAAVPSDYAFAVEQKLHEMASPYRVVSEWYSEDLSKLFQDHLVTSSAFESLVHKAENALIQDFRSHKFAQCVEEYPLDFFAKTFDDIYGWYSQAYDKQAGVTPIA